MWQVGTMLECTHLKSDQVGQITATVFSNFGSQEESKCYSRTLHFNQLQMESNVACWLARWGCYRWLYWAHKFELRLPWDLCWQIIWPISLILISYFIPVTHKWVGGCIKFLDIAQYSSINEVIISCFPSTVYRAFTLLMWNLLII